MKLEAVWHERFGDISGGFSGSSAVFLRVNLRSLQRFGNRPRIAHWN